MDTVPENVKTVKAPILPGPDDDDDYAPVPDWVDWADEEPFDEAEQERALSAAAREQAARHDAWIDAGRPAFPCSDAERFLDRYIIHPELATWLAHSGGHERA